MAVIKTHIREGGEPPADPYRMLGIKVVQRAINDLEGRGRVDRTKNLGTWVAPTTRDARSAERFLAGEYRGGWLYVGGIQGWWVDEILAEWRGNGGGEPHDQVEDEARAAV